MNKLELAPEQRMALSNPAAPIISFDEWEVKELMLTWEKVDALWEVVKQFRSIFSDITRDDKANFNRLLTSPEVYWLEAYKAGELKVLMYVQGLENGIDAAGHMVSLDRETQDKTRLVREIAKYLFANFPINRLTAPTARMYFATCRLLQRAGFTEEGVKRQAFLLGGRWHDIVIYGLLRSEVSNELPTRQDKDTES